MTVRDRIDQLSSLCHLFPELAISGRECLSKLLTTALGSLDALESFVPYGDGWSRAIAPRRIYHVLAGNLPVSGWRSLLEGLLLGSENFLQCPKTQKDAMVRFRSALPPILRKRTRILSSYTESAFASADAVVVFGRDETVRLFQSRCRKGQLFVGYGHRASLLWLGTVQHPTPILAQTIVRDLTTYDQLGCLSPQCVVLEAEALVVPLAEQLARALSERSRLHPTPRGPEEAARIREARTIARALGWPVWDDGDKLQWTLVVRDIPQFQPTCGHQVLYLDKVPRKRLENWLTPLQGQLSAIGVAARPPASIQKLFWRLGASRFCPLGMMQTPHPFWHHDGRTPLTDLIRWVDWEGPGRPEPWGKNLPRASQAG
ncbi:MAG: acyl-CoA reductase [Candidatus Methylacidiphilaceae bacterium]